MKQAQVTQTLKRLLKNQRITYKDLANRIQSTEAAIKNIFYSDIISLEKLLAILEVIPIDAARFFALVDESENLRFSFSEPQESFFVENPHHFRFFEQIFFQGVGIGDLQRMHNLSEISMHTYIRDIEKLGIWTYRGNGSFQFHVSGPLNWRKNGPWMQRYYRELTLRQAEAVLKSKPEESDFVSFGVMSLPPSQRNEFQCDLEHLVEEYRERAYNQHLLKTPHRELFGWNMIVTSNPVELLRQEIPNINEES